MGKQILNLIYAIAAWAILIFAISIANNRNFVEAIGLVSVWQQLGTILMLYVCVLFLRKMLRTLTPEGKAEIKAREQAKIEQASRFSQQISGDYLTFVAQQRLAKEARETVIKTEMARLKKKNMDKG